MSQPRAEYVPKGGGGFEAQVVEAAVSSIGQPEEISAKKNSVQLVYSPRDFSIGGEEVRTVDQEHRVAEAL